MLELIYQYDMAPMVPAPTAGMSPSAYVSDEYFPVIEPNGLVIGRSSRKYCHSGTKPLHPVDHFLFYLRLKKISLKEYRVEIREVQFLESLTMDSFHDRLAIGNMSTYRSVPLSRLYILFQ